MHDIQALRLIGESTGARKIQYVCSNIRVVTLIQGAISSAPFNLCTALCTSFPATPPPFPCLNFFSQNPIQKLYLEEPLDSRYFTKMVKFVEIFFGYTTGQSSWYVGVCERPTDGMSHHNVVVGLKTFLATRIHRS